MVTTGPQTTTPHPPPQPPLILAAAVETVLVMLPVGPLQVPHASFIFFSLGSFSKVPRAGSAQEQDSLEGGEWGCGKGKQLLTYKIGSQRIEGNSEVCSTRSLADLQKDRAQLPARLGRSTVSATWLFLVPHLFSPLLVLPGII